MSHIHSIFRSPSDTLFIESTGSENYTKDKPYYDTDSGKWYRTLFDLEQAFYESNFYDVPSIDTIPTFKDNNFSFTPLSIAFTVTDMNMKLLSDWQPKIVGTLDGRIKAEISNISGPDFD